MLTTRWAHHFRPRNDGIPPFSPRQQEPGHKATANPRIRHTTHVSRRPTRSPSLYSTTRTTIGAHRNAPRHAPSDKHAPSSHVPGRLGARWCLAPARIGSQAGNRSAPLALASSGMPLFRSWGCLDPLGVCCDLIANEARLGPGFCTRPSEGRP